MRYLLIAKILGLLLMLFSFTLFVPYALSIYYNDGEEHAFLIGFFCLFLIGLALYWPNYKRSGELKLRDGFLVVVIFWLGFSSMASIPLWLAVAPGMTLIEALFEATSGLTTTGATILLNLNELPISVLFYRQQLQFFGGMGIVVLAVAVLPMLGVGGMQLYRAETPGPIKDNKLTPRITETAKALWFIYLGLTVACSVAYYFAGMNVFDAISHAFSTVAIGGFSTHDESLGYFQSHAVNLVAVVFMLLAGLNFTLHFIAFRQRKLTAYFQDPEAKVYFAALGLFSIVVIAVLMYYGQFDDWQDNLVHGLLHTVSTLTTTGFTATNFSVWPTLLPVLLILLSVIGGCAGSTAGGMKVIRVILLYKQGVREVRRLLHPSALMTIKLGGKTVPDSVINAVWGFLSLYILVFVILYLAVLATGLEPMSAFSAVLSCLNNLGPGLSQVASDYTVVSDPAKLILCFAMLLGRLELFTLLVLFSRHFWR